MVSISDIENGRYYWETEYSHANNTESANDFIKNELPSNVKVIKRNCALKYKSYYFAHK